MKKTALNQHNAAKNGIRIPDGFYYLSGDRFSGKDLKICDKNTKSIYIWIKSHDAVEKINHFIDEIDKKIKIFSYSQEEYSKNAKGKYERLREHAVGLKMKLALMRGIFYKKGSTATFRM